MQLSSSLHTDGKSIDNNGLDCIDIFKTSDTSKMCSTATIDLKALNMSKKTQVDLYKNLDSPLQKNLEYSDSAYEKTPAFKLNQTTSAQKKKKAKEKNKTLHIIDNQKTENTEFMEQCKTLLVQIAKNQEKKTVESSRSGDEIDYVEKENFLNMKIKELNSEHERKIRYLEDHINKLKKDNERLGTLLDDKEAYDEVKKNKNSYKNPTDQTIDSNRAYIALAKAYDELKEENKKLKQNSNSKVCGKCKAFLVTNSELSNKILRLRNYLNAE